MKTEISKKIKVSVLIMIYLITWLYQSWEVLFRSDVFANITKVENHIVAIFVDKDLYSNTTLKNSIERYTTQYIQSQISNSKAVVFPIDTQVVKSWDIAKMLESLYYDGIEKEPSSLDGVILIGDKIPLPVVNDNGAVFPTVLPYTDFDDPKFYRDPITQYFLPNGVAKAQPEIRHSIINLESNASDYVVYFQKLKSYYQNPNAYVGDRIWYEDFIDQKKTYNDLNLTSYMNKFLFAEDLAYHRYNPLLIDLFNDRESDKKNDLVGNLSSLTGESGSYSSQVGTVFSGLLSEFGEQEQATSTQVPTVFVDDALQGFQKKYSDLYGVTSIARMRDNILAAGRRDSSEIDNHGSKIEYFDQLYTKTIGEARVPMLAEANKQLENSLLWAVKNNNYSLHIAIPQDATIQKHVVTRTWDEGASINNAMLTKLTTLFGGDYYKAGIYEAFYYGKNASTITGLDQTSIFLGTPNPIGYNLDNLGLYTGYNHSGSVGVSQGILSDFVEANRGYVVSLGQPDLDFKEDYDICGEEFVKYRDGYLGGNTPLNLTGGVNGLELMNKRYDRGGKSNWLLAHTSEIEDVLIQQAGSIFNIAGSRRVYAASGWMFAENLQGGYLQRVAFQKIKFTPWIPLIPWSKKWVQVDPCDLGSLDAEPLQNHDIYSYSNLIQTGYQKDLTIGGNTLLNVSVPCPADPIIGSACFPYFYKDKIPSGKYVQKQNVNYKIIDSIAIHTSPTPQQVGELENTTPSRPIDSIRYIGFKGIAGNRVRLPFPNLYAVAIYKQDTNNPNKLLLKTKEEIKITIRSYLTDIITSYNNKLQAQLAAKDVFYATNTQVFNALGNVNNLATPNRSYSLLQPTLFNNIISNEMVDSIAQTLYIENSLIPYKNKTTNLADEYNQFYAIANITNKKQIILQEYLTKQLPLSPLSLPDYQTGGYELISLVSDGDDSITSQQTPVWLVSLQKKISEFNNYQNGFKDYNGDSIDQEIPSDSCAASYGEPVPLIDLGNMSFPWFKVFACWLERIGTPKVTFDFKNAQGPVFVQGSFKDYLQDGLGGIQEGYEISSPSTTPGTSEEKALVNNLDLGLSTQGYALEDNVPLDLRPTLLISQKNTIDTLSLRINSTGDTCIMINNINTCNSTFQTTLTDKHYISPYLVPVLPKAGSSTLIIKICKGTVCTTQTLSLLITPGPLSQASIVVPSTRILSQSQIPLQVQAKDKYNNILSTTLSPLTIRSSTGVFFGGSTGFSLSSFRQVGQFIAPKLNGEVEFNLYNKQNELLTNKKITILSGTIQVSSGNSYYNTTTKSLLYTLPKKSQIYLSNKNINTSLLPQLSIQLKGSDGQGISGPVLVRSDQGLFSVYQKITNAVSPIVPSTGLQKISTLVFENNTTLSLVLQPNLTNNVGSDNLVFLFPDGSEKRIPITIRPSEQGSRVTIESHKTKKLLDNNETIPLTVQIFDDWNNIVVENQTLQIDTFGSLGTPGVTSLSLQSGTAQLMAKTDELGGPGYIKISGNTNLVPGLRITQVKKSIIPKTNINGLYLNLVGTSRGNTFDENADYFNTIPQVLKTSKVLATTTELISPETIGTLILTFNNDGTLSGSQAEQWIVTTSGSSLLAQNPLKKRQVVLGTQSDWPWASQLLPATEYYPEDFSLYTKLVRSQGTTNSSKNISLMDSTLVYQPNKVDSVEESFVSNNNIGWRNNQQHLLQFGQGKSVGEATIENASEFLVNYGDPLIKRKTKNPSLVGANLDSGPGQLIVSDTTKTIVKAFALDVNNDGLEDIVTVFTDGSVSWSKQNGGKENIYIDMGPLLQIYGSIKSVFGADTDGDGYGDIIVQNENDDLRVYINKLGIFNVDGYPICLDAEQEEGLPQRVNNIDQWFIEDMDKDTRADIVINKSGEIRIIYGGSAGNGHSYISQNTIGCDSNRQTRQTNYTKLVDNIATQLFTGDTLDNSLIRRKGLTTPNETLDVGGNTQDTTTNNPYISTQISSTFSPGNMGAGGVPNLTNFPIEAIVDEASANLMRWSVSPFDFYPSYETIDATDIRYLTTSELKTSDQVRVIKKYEDLNAGVLKKGDQVKVTVKITGIRNEAMTYIDRIQGPWNIAMANGVISGWNAGTLSSSASYDAISPQGDFYFVVDNITLGSSNMVEFSYTLTFQGGSAIKIAISDRNHDEYKDISVYPLDGCAKFLRTYTNTRSLIKSYREYTKEFIDVGANLEAHHNSSQQNTQNYLSGMSNSIGNVASGGDIQDIFNDVGSEQMSFGNFFQEVLEGGAYSSFNVNVSLLGDFETQVSSQIKDTLDSICSGGPAQDQSCQSGLPVPFNMAFLSPGTFNIMGCTPKVSQIDNIFPKDSGFPIFAFPATLLTPAGPLPLPFPFGGIQKGATDSYGYFGFPSAGGVYPSQIRIYMSPTLTQQLGMAICFGPQKAGEALPAPFSSIGGNCIVTKVKMPSGSCNVDNGDGNSDEDGGLSDQDILDLAEFGQCTQTKKNAGTLPSTTPPTSPFVMVGVDASGNTSNPFPPGTYFGVINFEKTPIVLSEFDPGDGVVLQGGQAIQPQVQGGGAKGMVACIVNDWMDRQTNYIINNLTNMQIGIYLPDLSQLGKGFDSIGSQIQSDTSPVLDVNNTTSSQIINNPNTFSGSFISSVRNSTIKKSQVDSLSTTLNNPFKEIEKLFEQTPLININTQDVVINVPMLYSEDITRYEAQLQSWIERNKQTAADRTSLLEGVFGLCGRDYSLVGENQNSPVSMNDSNFIAQMKDDLIAKKSEAEEDLLFAKECKANGRNNIGNCGIFMNKYGIGNASEGAVAFDFTQDKTTVTNTCLDIVGGSLAMSLNNIISITSQSEAFENRIRENIKVLDQYKRFPLQLYEWIHVTDRYLGEIVSTVENFLGYISLWLNTNATRFEQYVDAIITISTALETWQAILDLSVDWQQKCSTCTVDSYDAYACSLGFLCGQLKLPILKLPPFKIPNIYIDLSHIDLSMDILLPNFQFVPTSVPLIEIPDIPNPPSILIEGDLLQITDIAKILAKFSQLFSTQIPLSIPTIPLLPQPPTLPELPSFIPNINIELPVLPPAPKLPRIAPEIETVINVVSFFSDLYCIVKGGIGLVGESNVKTRIEQLTQRTREIPLFDNINLTQDMSYQQDKLEGFDFKIDAYVNFTMNFSAVYDVIKGIADQINAQTKKITDRNPNEKIGTDKFQEYVNDMNSHTQQNIDLTNPFGYEPENNKNLIALEDEKNTIKQISEYMISLPQTPEDKKEKLYSLIDRTSAGISVQPDTKNIGLLQTKILSSLDHTRENIKGLGNQLKDYDNFLLSLNKSVSDTYVVYTGEKEYGASLLDNTNNTKLPEKSLMTDYIALQKKLLGNYDKGLYQVTSSSNKDDVNKVRNEIAYLEKGLQLTDDLYKEDTSALQKISRLTREYNSFDNLKYNNQAAVCSSLGNMSANPSDGSLLALGEQQTVNDYPNAVISAQAGGGGSNNTTTFSSNLYDFSSYNNKVMIPFPLDTSTRYLDVIQSDYFSNRNKGHQVIEINNDGQKDILHRDQSQVWVKYGQQNSSHSSPNVHTHTNKFYVAPIRDEENEREERTNNNGYFTINGTAFKLYSKDRSVKNLRVRSQDYDSFSLSWTNSNRQQAIDGYLIELNKVPEAYQLKAHNDLPNNLQSRYVLLLPENKEKLGDISFPSQVATSENAYLSIHNQLTTKKIKNLLTGTLIDVVTYSVDAGQISYSFTNIERSWYYTRVASIVSDEKKNPLYKPSSPWSHHVVAGQQLIADTDSPIPDIRLIREKTSGLIDTGLNPQGIVNTSYSLQIQWDDPSGVLQNSIMNASGDVLSIQSGGTNILTGLYFVSNQNVEYRIGAKDSTNNSASETLILSINIPTIEIQDIIDDNSILGGLNILSVLSKGMDEGIVKFERKRNNIWKTLSNPAPLVVEGNQNSFNYSLGFNQTLITGGVYNVTNDVEFFSSQGATIATMKKDTGKITITPDFIGKVDIRPDISSQVPAIILYDLIQQKNLFVIKPKSVGTALVANTPYIVQSLSGAQYGSFAGGSCIMNTDNECVIVMNSQGDVVIQSPHHANLKASSYTFSEPKTSMAISTLVGNQVGTISFTATLP